MILMRAIVAISVTWVLLVQPGIGNAAYVIKLKNGNHFITSRYWHEGEQVMFDTYGGVFGVDKDSISKIEKSDKTAKIKATVQKAFEDKPEEAIKKDDSEPKKASAPTKVRKDDNPILTEFNALKEKFKTIDKMLTNELSKFIEELSDFRNKILATGNVNPYIQEFTEATDMGNATEALLKSRSQL